MENRTKFNLTRSIDEWTSSLKKSGAFTTDNLYELESHLIDEMELLKNEQLSEEEAFLIAMKRIGRLDTLVSEYGKTNHSKLFLKNLEPYLKGILFFLSFMFISEFLFKIVVLLGYSLELETFYVSTFSIVFLFALGLIFLLVPIAKSRGKLGSFHRLNKLSILLPIAFFSKLIAFICTPVFTRYFSSKVYGELSLNFHLFSIAIFILVIISSFAIVLSQKKVNKLILQN